MSLKAYSPIEGKETEAVELANVSFGRIVQCRPSGLIRFYPPRTQEELGEIHSTPEYFDHPYFIARRDIASRDVHRKHVETFERIAGGESLSNLKLLDIGCDTGAFMLVGRDKFGMKVTGLEVSDHSARVGREQHGLNIVTGQLLPPHFPDGEFDLVTLLDVIEHLSDPRSVLQEIHRILRPGGRIYIITADHDSLLNSIGTMLNRVLGRKARGILEKLYIPYHEYYFTKPTLKALLEGTGFEIRTHQSQEFPLNEFGHGWHFKLVLRAIFALQTITGKQTLQEVVAVRS